MAGIKHTPWSASKPDDTYFDDWNVCRADGLAVAAVVQNGDITPQEVEEAALLIAAAPELLAALQGAIGALEFSQDYHRDLGNEDQAFAADRLDAARSAIAKATASQGVTR